MNYEFKFIKGRRNTEVFRVPVHDPANVVSHILNEDGNINPDSLSKIELIVGDVIISTETSEIMWKNDVIQIKPSNTRLLSLPKRAHSELVAYNNDEGTTIGHGIVIVVGYG